MIKIEFQFESEYGIYRDAIVLTNNHTMTTAEIEAIKLARFEAWKNAVTPKEDEE